MPDDLYKLQVKRCLEESGYKVKLLDEDQRSKRADLLAQCESDTLLVEVKCKYDDLKLYTQLQAANEGKSVPYYAKIERKNSLAAVIKEATQQIQASRFLSKKAFSMLWFHPDPKLGFSDSDEQISMNLYGGRYAFVDAPDGSHWCMKCYYTSYSDFFRYASLDAVALHGEQGVQLLPNPFSERASLFKETRIHSDFEQHSAIWTPEILAACGKALYLHRQVNLKDLEAIRKALEEQNPRHRIASFVDMGSYGGVMKVNRNSSDKSS